MSRQTHLRSVESEDSVDQEEQPASPVTSSSSEHQNVESSSSSSDGKELPCDLQVHLTSSSGDSSTEGDTDNSDNTKIAEEPVD